VWNTVGGVRRISSSKIGVNLSCERPLSNVGALGCFQCEVVLVVWASDCAAVRVRLVKTWLRIYSICAQHLSQFLQLLLQLSDFLTLHILLYFVFNLFDVAAEEQALLTLLAIVICGWDINKHECFGVASDWISHQMSQLVVPVWHVLVCRACGKRRDDIFERCQTLVDCSSFLELSERRVRLLDHLRACQVNKG